MSVKGSPDAVGLHTGRLGEVGYSCGMLSLKEARSLVHQHVSSLPVAGTFLSEALGRRLAGPVLAPEDQPAFDRSAMDGYAFVSGREGERMRIVGEVRAGDAGEYAVGSGECVRIHTGGRVPAGCTRVLPQEQAQREGMWMTPLAMPERSWIRKRGEDARAGEVLIRGGTFLGPGDLALLASVGVAYPVVAQRVRVLHVATGNELVSVQERPAAGQIRDSNSTLVAALLRECGATLVRQHRAGDTLDALLGAVRSVEETAWDVLLISGGAGGGDFDFGALALESLGFSTHFRGLNLRPGKPLVFGTRGSQVAFVIPGNPVSHFVTFHVVMRFALELLGGVPREAVDADPASETLRLPLSAPWQFESDKRETWCPARLEAAGGSLRVRPLAWQSSGDLGGLVGVSALLRVRSGEPPVAGDGTVECLVLGLPRSLP